MVTTGKQLAKAFYNIIDKGLKSYYFGCYEGGRVGLKAVQAYPDDYDGVVTAARVLECYRQSSAGLEPTNCSKGGPAAPTSGTVTSLDAQLLNSLSMGPILSNGKESGSSTTSASTDRYMVVTVWDNATQTFEGDAVFRNIPNTIQLIGGWTTSTWPDLTPFHVRGSKLITWAGEHDNFFRHAFCGLLRVAPDGLNETTGSGSSTQSTIWMWPTASIWDEHGMFSCECVKDVAEKLIKRPDAWDSVGTLI
ncbi:hypothetical protein GE09DRAFT_1264689 [Coniochaeta sp. 2T2.1]|nr:hypothetical protein GE09DRAFT_1264689 [Coniochaeta sp. 2T2.1]